MSQKLRLDWVDTAKGLSILLVVMMHSAFGVGAQTGEPGVLHYIIGFATPFRMPEFFLISGLFLSMVIARPWKQFADRRVVHYLYFYALWAVLQIVVKTAIGTGEPGTALSYLAWAIVEPYGVLWFIYMLAVFSAVAKLLWQFKLPHLVVLGAAALLQIAPIATPSYALNQFAEYFVFFYAGYAGAPLIFSLIEKVQNNLSIAISGLVIWASLNATLVFSPGYAVTGEHVEMGLAGLPVVRLVMALSGSIAVCTLAAIVQRSDKMDWLRWLGANSIVVYLAFAIPMAISRTVLLKIGLITDTSILSIIVMLVATISPLVLFAAIKFTGWGSFLFARPDWAGIPGTKKKAATAAAPSAANPSANPVNVPAE